MTVKEYAKREGITKQAVCYRLRAGKIPGRLIRGGTPSGRKWEIGEAASNGSSRDACIVLASRKLPTLEAQKVIEVAEWLAGAGFNPSVVR